MIISWLNEEHVAACQIIAKQYSQAEFLDQRDFTERGLVVMKGDQVCAFVLFLNGVRSIYMVFMASDVTLSTITKARAVLLLVTFMVLMAKKGKKRIIWTMDRANVAWCNAIQKRLPVQEGPDVRFFSLEG